ncbi:restriction endonuclease [Flavitalea sp. BT771]|uniref:restriction endonuclease n=1 Tax=Flavitalea sp. BT771 TaxID=3063329 RepID=UPI0026E3197B|nr:restriction endonuclease [Flavitalea sp. BT771]MDO6433321.1 restriction endonuclease [Flavitalea sp. BT771]MDV6222774.1 restriction endonuclease [Flavitalea sp. BT771]
MNSDLEGFYKKMTKAQASLIKKMFKHHPSAIVEEFVYDQLISTGTLFLENGSPGREAFHICNKCWKKVRIGTKDLRACLGAGEGRPCYFVIVVSTSGFTKQVVKFAQATSKPVLLCDLDQLIMAYLSRNISHKRSSR